MAPKRKRERKDAEDLADNEPPTDIDPYAVLAISKDVTQDEVKAAYRKAALKNHPDKASPDDKEAAHSKFQEIAFAYAILSDERRRKRYDATGRTEESLDDDDFDWMTFFREQFENVVTTEAINRFEKEYKGSEEEREHVLQAYTKNEGAMVRIYQEVMLSDMLEDEDRFRVIIDEAIENGEVEAYKKYTDESEKSRKRRMDSTRKDRERNAKQADKRLKELEEESKKKKGKAATKQNGDTGDLAALIQQRQQGRAENFFGKLEEKYAPKGKKGAKRAMDEPPEEAFAKNRESGKNKKTKR